MKRTKKKTNINGLKPVLDTFDWLLALELDGDSRCGGDTWICDC